MTSTHVDFQRDVLLSPIPVLVDFSAEWCGPCRAIEPHVEAVANELAGKAKVVKIDVDSHADVAGRYGIMSIPALVVFSGGQEVDRLVGAAPKETIKALLQRYIK